MIEQQIMDCYRDIFFTLAAMFVMTMICAYFCYLDYKQELEHNKNRKKRLAQRCKRREGTKWEIQR